ncbi:hypothetical protein [Campylobacter phage CJLB-14]|nr:hypothetical protein [Campylobacter phage CJLB-14]
MQRIFKIFYPINWLNNHFLQSRMSYYPFNLKLI